MQLPAADSPEALQSVAELQSCHAWAQALSTAATQSNDVHSSELLQPKQPWSGTVDCNHTKQWCVQQRCAAI